MFITMDDCQVSDWSVHPGVTEKWTCPSPTVSHDMRAYCEMPTSPVDAIMEDDDECHEKYEQCLDQNKYFAVQMSPEEYKVQGDVYTKTAVASLLQSKEYLQRYTRCTLCWCIWSEGMYTDSCMECGGYAMERPCPVCNGRCNQVWKRDVDMSHGHNEAHWEGSCGLPEEEQQQFMASVLMEEANEDSVLDDIEELRV